MRKDDGLLAHSEHSFEIWVYDVVHDIVCSLKIAGFFDSIEATLQRCWPVARIEIECAFLICSDELGDIIVVRQCGREADNSDWLLIFQPSGDSSSYQALQDKSSTIVEQMNFIDDQTIDSVHHTISFSCHHIPLFWRGNDDMGLSNFRLADAHISSQLTDFQFQISQSCFEFCNDLSSQCFQWCNIHDLKWFGWEIPWTSAVRVYMLTDLSQNSEESNICLTSTCRSGNDHASALFESNWIDDWLNLIELLGVAKGWLAVPW